MLLLVLIQVSIKGGESCLNKYVTSILKQCDRENGEHAFGHLASPMFLRVGSCEEANQIFVNAYMELSVACFV